MTPKRPHLQIGKAYFECAYFVSQLPVPDIQVWIYIGTNLGGELFPDTHHYFDRPERYFATRMLDESAKWSISEGSESEAAIDNLHRSSRMRIANQDLEGLIYDYEDFANWVSSLVHEPNAQDAF